MTMHLKQTFEAVILTEKFPKSQIDIYVEVFKILDFRFIKLKKGNIIYRLI